MTYLAFKATLLLVALAGAAGSRELLNEPHMAIVGAPSAGGDLGSAPAPGPAAGTPPADVLFMLTAAGAMLSADELVLTSVANTALFSTASREAGIYSTAAFTNVAADSEFVSHNGRWLNDPVVVLRANATSALLQLASPMYNKSAKTVTFQSKILRADASTQLPTAHGVTARYIDDAANGVTAGALTAPPAGHLTHVALFIDATSHDVGRAATTKWGGYGWSWNNGGWGWQHYGGSNWGYGGGWGWHWGK